MLTASDEKILNRMKKDSSIKIYGEKIDLSKGVGGLLEPLKNIATNPKALADTMQGLENAKKIFGGEGLKGVDNFMKNIFQN